MHGGIIVVFGPKRKGAGMKNFSQKPIGVFDSGIGGLTVLSDLRKKFPAETFLYVGDTARLPYGTKSPQTIIKYAEGITRHLLKQNVKALVIACNTASACALEAVQVLAKDIPVIGMVDPAARKAVAATRNNHIAVIGTSSTIAGKSYEKALKVLKPDVKVTAIACQMLVALAEEGWSREPIAQATIEKYLKEVFSAPYSPDVLILGCTHFPVFIQTFRKLYGDVTLILCGEAAAESLIGFQEGQGSGNLRFQVTDDPARFHARAGQFFDQKIVLSDIDLIDITSV